MTDWDKMAVEAEAWKWLDGMLGLHGQDRYSFDELGGADPYYIHGDGANPDVPDLTDPATQGAVLFGILVQEGWNVEETDGINLGMRRRYPSPLTVYAPVPEALARALRATTKV
jgi:hypothetical protein